MRRNIFCPVFISPARQLTTAVFVNFEVLVYGASRHLQSENEAPSSVTVITRDEIQQSRAGARTSRASPGMMNATCFSVAGTITRTYCSISRWLQTDW
jgi:hypothetical protein